MELSKETKETVDKITSHFKQDVEDNIILKVNPGEELKSMLELRDLIKSKSHTSMIGMYG